MESAKPDTDSPNSDGVDPGRVVTYGALALACHEPAGLSPNQMVDSRRGAVLSVRSLPSPRPDKGERVAFCVTSSEARATIRMALKTAGIEAVPAVALQLQHVLGEPQSIHALIHDLHPWDSSIVNQMEGIRLKYPALPILIYAPLRPGIAGLLVRCARIPYLQAELQRTAGAQELEHLRSLLRSLIDEMPSKGLLRILATALPDAPRRAWTFTQMALENLRRGNISDQPTVAALAHRLGVSERTLERSWDRSVLPAPKELLAWLALMLVTFTAAGSGTSTASVAHDLGLGTQQLYRLRQRLLPAGIRTTDFEMVFLAFCERCRSSSGAALPRTLDNQHHRRFRNALSADLLGKQKLANA